MDISTLADLLHETAEQHGRFEAIAPPHHWEDWYAAYLHARQEGHASTVAAEAADRYLLDVKHVAPSGPSSGGPR